jgi:gamma-glutamylputrescine oxidase
MLSIWEKQTFFAPTDVLIAGSGFVGLWSAYFLKKANPSLRITIIDKGVVPTGASTRNAGFACFGSVTELLSDVETMGRDSMLELVEKRFRGLQTIFETFKASDIHYEQCGGYELITAREHDRYPDLFEKIAWLNDAVSPITRKKHTYRFVDQPKAFGFENIHSIISNELEGGLHSGWLCRMLLLKVQEMGVVVLSALAIEAFNHIGDHLEIATDQGIVLKTNYLLICTNAFAAKLHASVNISPARGQVLLTSPIEGGVPKGAFHCDEGFYYFRNLGDRILLGGARNKAFNEEATAELAVTDRIQSELELFLRQVVLPGRSYTITDRWSGIMGMSDEKKPVIRELEQHVYCAIGLGGMGVALAPTVALEVADLLTQR